MSLWWSFLYTSSGKIHSNRSQLCSRLKFCSDPSELPTLVDSLQEGVVPAAAGGLEGVGRDTLGKEAPELADCFSRDASVFRIFD